MPLQNMYHMHLNPSKNHIEKTIKRIFVFFLIYYITGMDVPVGIEEEDQKFINLI